MRNNDLESCLKTWSWWKNNISHGNAGWPHETILSKMISYGGMIPTPHRIIGENTQKCPIQNDTAEEIDNLIKKMNREYPEYAMALADYYLGNYPIHILVKIHKCSRSSYMQRVKSAKVWLSGYIASKTLT